MVKGTYRLVEKVFLVACVFYIAYPISCFLAHPAWKEAVVSTVSPSVQFDHSYLYMMIGLVGTTIAPWMQFYLQSAVVEKGIKLKDYAYSRWDVIVGCIVTDVVAFFIIVACAATIYASGHRQISRTRPTPPWPCGRWPGMRRPRCSPSGCERLAAFRLHPAAGHRLLRLRGLGSRIGHQQARGRGSHVLLALYGPDCSRARWP